MYYAHKGSSSDNAFTVLEDGNPIREFMGFETKKERISEQDKIWKESNQEQNLIFCTRKFVEKYYGRDFYVDEKGYVQSKLCKQLCD